MPLETEKASIIVPVGIDRSMSNELIECISSPALSGHEVILVVDQTSTNKNSETSDSLATLSTAKHHHVKILYGSFDGPGLCRNHGLQHATNDWIIFWDADDAPILESFLAMLKFAINEEKSIVVSQAIRVDADSNEKLIRANWLGLLAWPGIWRILFKRRVLDGKEFTSWKWCEDQDFILNTFPSSLDIGWFDRVTYKYRQSSAGSTTKDEGNSIYLNRFYERLRLQEGYQASVVLVQLFRLKTVTALYRRNPRSWMFKLISEFVATMTKLLLNFAKLRRNI